MILASFAVSAILTHSAHKQRTNWCFTVFCQLTIVNHTCEKQPRYQPLFVYHNKCLVYHNTRLNPLDFVHTIGVLFKGRKQRKKKKIKKEKKVNK